MSSVCFYVGYKIVGVEGCVIHVLSSFIRINLNSLDGIGLWDSMVIFVHGFKCLLLMGVSERIWACVHTCHVVTVNGRSTLETLMTGLDDVSDYNKVIKIMLYTFIHQTFLLQLSPTINAMLAFGMDGHGISFEIR